MDQLPYKIFQDVSIGDNCDFSEGVVIQSFSRIGSNVIIGKNTSIAPNCIIGDDVYIGANVVVEQGSYIESKCIIRDNVVIKGNVPTGKVVTEESQKVIENPFPAFPQYPQPYYPNGIPYWQYPQSPTCCKPKPVDWSGNGVIPLTYADPTIDNVVNWPDANITHYKDQSGEIVSAEHFKHYLETIGETYKPLHGVSGPEFDDMVAVPNNPGKYWKFNNGMKFNKPAEGKGDVYYFSDKLAD